MCGAFESVGFICLDYQQALREFNKVADSKYSSDYDGSKKRGDFLPFTSPIIAQSSKIHQLQ